MAADRADYSAYFILKVVFLTRVSSAKRSNRPTPDCLSVCLSVCHVVMQFQQKGPTIMQFSPNGSPKSVGQLHSSGGYSKR